MLRYSFVDQWPKLLTAILLVAGVAVLALALAANVVALGSLSMFRANQLALAVGGFALLLAGIVANTSGYQRQLGEWLVVAVGVLAAALAANLVTLGAFPGPAFKQVMLASVVLGAALMGVLANRQVAAGRAVLSFDKTKIAKYAGLALQLGLLVLVASQFELENQALYAHVLPLAFAGFLIHYFLPQRYRLPFFILLSLAGFFGIMGFGNGLIITALSLLLIGITQLPIRFNARVALLLVTVVLLIMIRAEWLPLSLPTAIWPVLGSLFMFRMIVYLYDMKHSKTRAGLQSTLAYFFLLPNVVFLLFPVIDFSTFRRTYYNEDEDNIYQTGVRWMTWGVIHLLLYRFINHNLIISPLEVTNASDIVRYIVPNFLLLLRVSGQFHLSVGILHLFGFNLPRTFRDYFAANSFTDFWRRANPYWRDFMVKTSYYPVYFRLQRSGMVVRLVISTVVVFIATWLFHAYQWYWLRGSFQFSAPDIAFWALFGIVVLLNTLYEAKHGRKRTLERKKWTARDAVIVSLQAIGTFMTVAIIYSLWTSSSVTEWLGLWTVLFRPLGGLRDLVPFVLVVVALSAGAIWSHLINQETNEKRQAERPYFRSLAVNAALILVVFLAGNPAVYARTGQEMPEVIADLRTSRLSSRDADLLLQGYYENLIGVNRFNDELWAIYSQRPADWPLLQDTELAQFTEDFRIMELRPNTQAMFHGAPFSVNSWGMRGGEVEQLPPPGAYRAAVVGPSFVLGSGVGDDDVFVQQVAERFNEEQLDARYDSYEFLNLGMAGHSALQELWILESVGLSFQPDSILYVAHQREEDIAVRNLADRIERGVDLPYEYLYELAERAGVGPGMSHAEIERALLPYGQELVSWTYERIASLARERDIDPLWVFVPILESPPSETEKTKLMRQATGAGLTVVDLSDVYDGFETRDLIVAEWDMHPNKTAHTLIADRLYEFMVRSGIIGN